MFNVGSATAYLKLNTTGWVSGMGAANSSITRLTRTFAKMGATVVGSLFLIEREFGKFDKAIRHATSVSETSGKQFEQMSQMALDASVRWNKAATSTAQAFYFLGSAGLTVTEQMQAFNTTIMLSRAMGSELSQTVEGVVDVVRAFGLEFANITDIADQLTKTVISSNQQFYTLSRALTYASSTARLTNNTLAETTAMLGVMANAGIKGSMAGTVLRRAMTNLMSPTGDMAELIYELGINIYDVTGKMKPFINIMGEISDKLRGTTDEYKNMVFEVLFGRRAIAGQIVLFNYGSEALRKYANEIRDAGGTTERVAGKQMKAFTEQLGRLWREMQRIAIMVGDTLAPAIERLANTVRDRLGVFKEYIDTNKEAVADMLEWIAVIGTASILIPPLILLMVGLANQFIQLGVALRKTGIALATNPFTWLIASLYVLRTTLATDFWKQAWENKIKPFLTVMGLGFTQTIAQIMWEFSLIPESIERAFSGEGILNTVKYFVKALQQVGLAARMVGASFVFDFKEVARLGSEFAKIDEEMRDLLFGVEGGKRVGFFGSDAERTASYQKYVDDLRIVGKKLKYEGRDILTDLGTALKDRVTKDMEILSGLVPSGLSEAYKNLRELIDIFMGGKGFFRGISTPGGTVGKGTLERMEIWYKLLMDVYDAEIKVAREAVRTPTIREERWKSGVVTVAKSMKTWRTVFANVNTDIRSEWADTINDVIAKGGTLEDFFENMFMGILNSFNRLVSNMLASDLWYALFGGGAERPWGVASLFYPGGVKGQQSKYSPTYDWQLNELMQRSLGLATPQGAGYKPWTELGMTEGARKMVPDVVINFDNTGLPANLRETGREFDGKQVIISTVLEEIRTNPNVAAAVRGT